MVSLTTVYRDVARVKPAPYGLLSPAVTVIEDNSVYWQGGQETGVTGYASVEIISADGTKKVTVAPANTDKSLTREYVPFQVRVSFAPSTFGLTPDEVKTMVREYAEAATAKAIEREFWTGALSKALTVPVDPETPGSGYTPPNRYLASSGAQVVNPAADSPVKTKYGLALLEQALGDCGVGERGVIHTTRGVGSALGIKGSDGRIETPIGNYIVAGTGYTGSGPDGDDPTGDEAWMYATGPVTVRLGPVEIFPERTSDAVNTSTNKIEYEAVRTAAISWSNDCHFAVLVDLSQDYS